MPSRACINFAHVECDYNKCRGRAYRLGHHTSCPYAEDEELVLAGDISDDVHTILSSTEDSSETDTSSSESSTLPLACTELALPADTLEKVQMYQTAYAHCIEHRKQHWMFCSDFYCKAHGSTNMLRNRYVPDYQSTCSTCGQHGHSTITCPIGDKILALHKLSVSVHLPQSRRSDWDRSPSPTDPDWASGPHAFTTAASWTRQESQEVVVHPVRERSKEVSSGRKRRLKQKGRIQKQNVCNTAGIKLSQTLLIVFHIQGQQSP